MFRDEKGKHRCDWGVEEIGCCGQARVQSPVRPKKSTPMLFYARTVFRSAPAEPDSCTPIQVPETRVQGIGRFLFHDVTFTILTQSNS
ncbi:hypothetical protein BLNAU_3049 [Blattamonas nauphoetae]|uniref:Uncharacterized protein n=1 Tax=Blattamonas nauphoetae TaxID=2049346 RepID=A0ABQ9YE12_9EUKA|nr:hypothetical protein BLNAU_3049 [Blattamonas nauphoetae]